MYDISYQLNNQMLLEFASLTEANHHKKASNFGQFCPGVQVVITWALSLTGQLADTPTLRVPTSRLVNSRTGQVAD